MTFTVNQYYRLKIKENSTWEPTYAEIFTTNGPEIAKFPIFYPEISGIEARAMPKYLIRLKNARNLEKIRLPRKR